MFRDRGERREILFVSCVGLVNNEQLMADMRDLMALIQEEYQHPVDIEYTINLSETGEYVINLLQCRPLYIANDTQEITIPETIKKKQYSVGMPALFHGTVQGDKT